MGKLSALWDLAKKEGADLADDAASRMARAAEQGFDVDTPLYRGSRSDERYQAQFYTPDPEYAAQYANLKTWKPDDDRPNVGKFYAEKPFSLKDNANTIEDFKSWYAQDQGRVPGDLIGDSGEISYFYANKLADYLGETRGARPPALLIDEANGQVATKVYKEGGVRSVNAMFDPSKRTSTDLLAGLAGATAVGAAVAPEDAEAGVITRGGKVKSALDDFVQATVRLADDTELPKTDYRGGHTAPIDPEYHAALYEMDKKYPDDIYSKNAAQYYGHGDPELDAPSFDVINAVRGKPDAPVTMYRAVPADAPDEILPGDWVTTNPLYAKDHGEMRGDYKILQGETVAKKLRTDGNSPHEYGYTGFADPALLGAIGVGAATTTALAPEMYRQMEETRRVVSDFAQRRAPKASFWKQKRDELLSLASSGIGAAVTAGIETVANNPLTSALAFQGGRYLDASQQPVQGVSALTALIASGDLNTAANVARMPQEAIADEAGGLVTDYLSQAGYPRAGALAGTAVNTGINMAGF